MNAPRIGTPVPTRPLYAPRLASSSTLSPVTVPSAFAEMVMSWIWSRPWCAASMVSDRDSFHFTGLPSFRATSSDIISSGSTPILPPKPPPTSGAITRSLCSGMPSVSADITRRMCGTWVADHMVIWAPVGSTTQARGSMNAGIRRCWRKRRLTTISDDLSASSTSLPVPASAESNFQTALVLLPWSSWTSGAPSAMAASMSRMTGSSSYSTSISSSASCASAEDRATTTATPSPAKLTWSAASTGRRGVFMSGVIGHAQGMPMELSGSRSVAV